MPAFPLKCIPRLVGTLSMGVALVAHPARGASNLPLEVVEDAGVARPSGHITSGVPFPFGVLRSADHVRLTDGQGNEVPLQLQTTATWRDGSIKWLLLDFQAALAAREFKTFTLESGPGVTRTPPAQRIRIDDQPDAFWLDTGPLRFSISKKSFGVFDAAFLDKNQSGQFEADEALTTAGLRQALTLTNEFAGWPTQIEPPEEVVVEEPGPLRAVVKISGWITEGGTNRLVQYLLRVHAFAGSSRVHVHHTVIQLSDRIKTLWVDDLSLHLKPRLAGPARYTFGGQQRHFTGELPAGGSARLTQLAEGACTVRAPDDRTERGLKSPGWVNLAGPGAGVLVATRFFWQQFPKAISVSAGEIRLGLYPAEEPKAFDMDLGLAKSHEILFTFHDGTLTPAQCAQEVAARDRPLFAIAPSSWYCDSKVFGDLRPFDFDLFPDYETLTEASGDQYLRKMATGLRHWGDFYYGGEYKGTNAYMNLEYDVHHNFYCQFARTGLRKYLDAAFAMGQHQADVDTNHKTGWQWKHSPRHVETQAEFGHTFTRGLLETYFLTGNRRCREAAITLGGFFAKDIQNARSTGNERQIGWGLISLLPVFEATWDPRFFVAASNTVERLLRGLDDRGKFDIRWDNRIAFFNGIAATGFLYYHRATGDERVAAAAYRVIRRARGFYPEYAGRTLEAISWAYQRTGEPEWLDFLKLTWETTLARSISWNAMELGAPTIFSVHALPFLAGSGLIPRPERPLRLTSAQFDTASGLQAHHLPAGDAELHLQVSETEPFDLVVIRKGAWKGPGHATLFDPSGATVAALDFPTEGVVWQRKVIPVAPAQRAATARGAWRLALRSTSADTTRGGGSYITWDVVSSRPMAAVFATREFRNLEFVTPALFTTPRGDSPKIELDLSGEGEGFKKAVILDPDGNVAGTMEAFIDLGDKGRYQYQVSAAIPPQHLDGVWQVRLQDVSVTRMSGLSPYFATSRQSFFRPERGSGNASR